MLNWFSSLKTFSIKNEMIRKERIVKYAEYLANKINAMSWLEFEAGIDDSEVQQTWQNRYLFVLKRLAEKTDRHLLEVNEAVGKVDDYQRDIENMQKVIEQQNQEIKVQNQMIKMYDNRIDVMEKRIQALSNPKN